MSWWTSSRRKVARLAALPWRDRVTLAAAFAALVLAEAGLRFLGLPRTRRLLAPRRRAAVPPPAEIERLVRLGAAACSAVYPAGCLPRSLVLERLLARRGAAPELRVGVRREAGELQAHAWVEVAGRPVGEPEGIELHFAPLEP
jgi:hypothetical protein